MKNIVVALLNWNNSEETLECLDSLSKVQSPNFQIVVVDNGSTDNSVQALKQFSKRTVVLLRNKENLGFAGGCNVALKWAVKNKQDYILLLNNDTTVKQNFLQELLQHAEKHTDVAFCTPSIFFTHQPSQLLFGGDSRIKWWRVNSSMENELYKKTLPKNAQPKDVIFSNGCATFARVDAVKKIGLMDERYFLYVEDVDFSFQARTKGWRILWVPSSHIYHKVSATTKKQGLSARYYYDTRNALYVAKRYGPKWTRVYTPFWCCVMGLKQAIKLGIGRNRDISKGVLWGIIDYYKGVYGQYKH